MGLVALAIYLSTLYPGLTDIGDASKFAFVGKVLGIPHAPGYPLYVLISHAFSYVPLGSLAYRMNVLSAVCGSIAVALVYLIGRRLDAGRAAAAGSAFGLAFGLAFWSKALYAKTYTLNAALVAAGILMLLIWADRRRARDLYVAIAVFGLSLGNHLTVIGLVPALVLFPIVTHARVALHWKTLSVTLLCLLLGLAQYGFIMLRTWQGALYVEASARSLSELWVVMTARRFAHEIGAFTWSVFTSVRVPVVGRLISTELGPIGALLLAVGAVVLTRQRPRAALLLASGALGVAMLTAAMGSGEDQGFLLPVFVLLWPIAAVGLEAVATGLRRAWPQASPAVAAVALLVMPLQLSRNYSLNNHRADTFEDAYFRTLFADLPDKTAIVSDEYRLNMMVLYKLLGERATGSRDIRHVPLDMDTVKRMQQQGFTVLAFSASRAELAESGFLSSVYDVPKAGEEARALFRLRPVFRIGSPPACLDLGNTGWTDIQSIVRTPRLIVRIDNYRAFDSRVTIYAAGDAPPDPMLVSSGGGGAGTPSLSVDVFRLDDSQSRQQLMAALRADEMSRPERVLAARFVARAQVTVNDKGAFSVFGVDLGPRVAAASARALVDRNNPKRARICSHSLRDADAWPPGQPSVTLLPDAPGVGYEEGWFLIESQPDGTMFRWTTDRAVVVLPVGRPRSANVSIRAEPMLFRGRPDGAITLSVNGRRLARYPLPSQRAALAWSVPAAFWRSGLNELVLDVEGAVRPSDVGPSPDNRLLGVSVTQIELSTAADGH